MQIAQGIGSISLLSYQLNQGREWIGSTLPPTAYQQTDMTTIVEPVNDAIPASLVDKSAPPEEVNDEIRFSFIQSNNEIGEVENDEGDEEGE